MNSLFRAIHENDNRSLVPRHPAAQSCQLFFKTLKKVTFGSFLMSTKEVKVSQKIIKESKIWADKVHRGMTAATLMNPSLMTFRSVALDEHETIIKNQLIDSLCDGYVPKKNQ